MISVDQLDTETSGLGVYHQRIADREPIKRVTPRLLIQMGAGNVERRIAAHEGLRDQLAHDLLAQARDQHEMA